MNQSSVRNKQKVFDFDFDPARAHGLTPIVRSASRPGVCWRLLIFNN
jgi:hypothetical protein